MADFELAQLNIAWLAAPLESPALTDFVENLNRINELAERTPGYVWRLQSEDGDATAFRPFGEEHLVNLTVWQDVESLHAYVYRTAHAAIMSRRKEWFERMREAYNVLWWVPAGHRPTVEEARSRLDKLRAEGASAEAFTFKQPFGPPGGAGPERLPELEDACLAI